MSAANRRRGVVTEQMVVRWFREHGYPGAERTVRTGYRTANRVGEDSGDVLMCPGLIAQVKSLRPANEMERRIPRWMAETEQQRTAARAGLALLIVRREGTADVGEWWVFWRAPTLASVYQEHGEAEVYPVHAYARLTVLESVLLLRAAGYGDLVETG